MKLSILLMLCLSSGTQGLGLFELLPKEVANTPICNLMRGSSPYRAIPSDKHNHGLMGIYPVDGYFDMGGYIGSFDGPDDDNFDGAPDFHAIPHFVAFQLNKLDLDSFQGVYENAIPPIRRYEHGDLKFLFQRKFIDVVDLNDSYKGISPYLLAGSLVEQVHADRISWEAGCNTYFFLNTVPMFKTFHNGLWKATQDLVGAWANRFGKIWVTAGPIVETTTTSSIGGQGKVPVVVPVSLFRIVSRYNADGKIKTLAFIYPQVDSMYLRKDGSPKGCNEYSILDHARYIVSIAEIELLTGLTFFSGIDKSDILGSKNERADLWEVDGIDYSFNCE